MNIGSVTAPAGARLEVVNRKEGHLVLRHPSGSEVQVKPANLLGIDYRQLVGVWRSGETHFYEFREDGSAVRTFLTYSGYDPKPSEVGTEKCKLVATPEKIVISFAQRGDVFEMKVPFDLEKPERICFREEKGQPTSFPFYFTKPSPVESSAQTAAERLLATE